MTVDPPSVEVFLHASTAYNSRPLCSLNKIIVPLTMVFLHMVCESPSHFN